MSDSESELELLALDQTVPSFEDHEIKTAPLVTRDAALIAGNFTQRGVLGSVLSVHAKHLPPRTTDPRLYMNLNAPTSGLVCGVQGSGKSHTVSCILESAMIMDRRLGTLPAPLATVVFHYDEENGGRPCEAAYLSELKNGLGRGVNEVVVLVSPSNLNTRKSVYKELRYVRVEALRIAEESLNASRMLSMMGADDLEKVPLYLHTALSMLREMGSDDFSYSAFRERLKASNFDQKQMAMLRLRLDLLDSFLKGSGGDVSFFFKPGRLVIIDLSDPFIDGLTAALLFDICLGLFIEWKASSGKLIVLDEAHKYLTNSDANRFTKTICSVIRQQRHLATRVIVSTQEPTVVPASVLDLLSWVICHRFSSPSWVKHLSHHICVEDSREQAEKEETSDYEWGRRVMALRTGEAILYSPASFFMSLNRKLANLSMGYAVIKSRPRITADGGASLLAAHGTEKETLGSHRISTEKMDIPISLAFRHVAPGGSAGRPLITPPPSSPEIEQPAISPSRAESMPNKTLNAKSSGNAGLPFSPQKQKKNVSLDVKAVTTADAMKPTISSDSPGKNSHMVVVTTSTQTPMNPASMPTLEDAKSHLALITAMNMISQKKQADRINISDLPQEIQKLKKNAYDGRLKDYMEQAQGAQIVTLYRKGSTIMASLHSSLHWKRFEPLVLAIKDLEATNGTWILFTAVSVAFAKRFPGGYKKLGFTRFCALIDAVATAGLVDITSGSAPGTEKLRRRC